jgi:hypothetical protein
MDPYNNTISWDGILCTCCRQLFESYNIYKVYTGPLQNPVWWYTIVSLKSCATSSYKLCELTLLSIEDKYLDKLESWQATLPVRILSNKQGSYTLRVSILEADPRPEAKELNDSNDINYNLIAIDLEIQYISGETS